MESCSNEPPSMTLAEAVFSLAFPVSEQDVEKSLTAIGILHDAPSAEQWDKGILLGLRHSDRKVIDKTIGTCVSRLENLPDDDAKDKFLNAILDACYLNLSGRIRNTDIISVQHSPEETSYLDCLEMSAAELLAAVSKFLQDNPLKMEHHRSRLLSRARYLMHMKGRGTLADSVVKFQLDLAKGERSDNQVTNRLLLNRKHEVYESSNASNATLLAYLNIDAELPMEKVTQELLQSYRYLLNNQTKEDTQGAILKALQNLTTWFSSAQFTQVTDRQVILTDALRAGVGASLDNLNRCIVWQLWAHLELLPGSGHHEDMLALLKRKYVSKEGENILIQALKLLQKMPLIRFRADDVCSFMEGIERLSRSEMVWDAFLGLIESMLTGMEDFVLSRECLTKEEKKRNSIMREVLKQDEEIRALLYKFSTDEGFKISNDVNTSDRVRERCWRLLLRCMPPNRLALYHEGISKYDLKYLIPTLEEAGSHYQRDLWGALQDHLDLIIHQNTLTKAEYHTRIMALITYFRNTRVFSAVRVGANSFGVILSLALDDSDSIIRDEARHALRSSGFGLLLECEFKKRELLTLRKLLTESDKQIIQHEEEVAQLITKSIELRRTKADHSLNIHTLVGYRDIIVTRNLIVISGIQISLLEVRDHLRLEIDSAAKQEKIINDLQDRIQELNTECMNRFRKTEALVRSQEQHESNIKKLQQTIKKSQKDQENTRRKLQETEAQVSRLRANPPSQPNWSDDPDEVSQQNAWYEHQVNSHNSDVQKNEESIRYYRSNIFNYSNEITSCKEEIQKNDREIGKLQTSINEIRQRIARLESRRSGLEREYHQGYAVWQAIRSKIDRLNAQENELQNRLQEEESRSQQDLAKNASAIEKDQDILNKLQKNLSAIIRELNSSKEKLDNQVTESQRLGHALDIGHQEYRNLNEQSVPGSVNADAKGFSLQCQKEREVLEEQEYKAHVAYQLNKGLRDKPLPVTHDEKKKKRAYLKSEI